MLKQTLARALHAWNEWSESITNSRQLLGYDPKWPYEKRDTWIEQRYSIIRNQAVTELERLDLPPNLRRYWEDCFYSDYSNEDGSRDLRKITRRLSDRRSLPDLPFDAHMVLQQGEEVTRGPWLRVEIRLHERFATKELLKDAAEDAYGTVASHLRFERIKPHPVCQWLKGGRPPIDDDRAVECARLRDDEKRSYKEIGGRYDWPLQKDHYGNLSLCGTAKRYVERGRVLRRQYQP